MWRLAGGFPPGPLLIMSSWLSRSFRWLRCLAGHFESSLAGAVMLARVDGSHGLAQGKSDPRVRLGSLACAVVFDGRHSAGNLPIALFLVTTMGLSVLFARMSVNAAFSVLPAILLHAAINWWSMALPITPMGADAGSYPLVAGLTTLVLHFVAYFMRGPKPSKYHKRSQ